MTNFKINDENSTPQDWKQTFQIAMEKNSDTKVLSNKSSRDKPFIRLLKSPAIPPSGTTKRTRRLSFDPDELCDGLKLSPQEKQAGNNSNIIVYCGYTTESRKRSIYSCIRQNTGALLRFPHSPARLLSAHNASCL